MSGAGKGHGLPLNVLAFSHEKNPRTFGTKAAGFLQKNVKRACSCHLPAGAHQFFYMYIYHFFH